MRPSAVLLALAACGSLTKQPAPDALVIETPAQCEASFDTAFPRACSIDADCVLLVHADCCHEIDIGVPSADLSAAQSAESTFNTCLAQACGGRGCGGMTTAEDGTSPQGGQAIVAKCVSQACTSTVQ